MLKIQRLAATAAAALVLSLGAGVGSAGAAQPAVTAAAVSAAKVGKYTVEGMTYTKWKANRGKLGNPVNNKTCTSAGCSQRFKNGYILWSSSTGARMVLSGSISSRYSTAGWTKGALGFPFSDARGLNVRGGQVQSFQGGFIYWSPKTGAHTVRGGIKSFYIKNTYERGFLGYPTAEETAVKNGVRQDFEGGKVYWSGVGGPTSATTNGDIQNYYEKKGGPSSSLGLPTSGKTSWRGGYYQRFQGGVITWGPTTGARMINTAHFNTLAKNFTKYGWPTKDSWTDGAGTHTQFQKGIRTTGAPSKPPVVTPPVVTPPEKPTEPPYPFTSDKATAKSVVLYGDMQLEGDSWGEQGARAMGFTDQTAELSFSGLGYSVRNAWAGGTAWTAVKLGFVHFPGGNPGLVMVTLGGTDASFGSTDEQVIADSTALWAKLKLMYPNSKIVVNGVMSRNDAAHERLRHIDALLEANAKKQGVTFISVAGLASKAKAEYLDDVQLSQAGLNAVAKLYTPLLAAALGR